jgi:hypothetical protein
MSFYSIVFPDTLLKKGDRILWGNNSHTVRSITNSGVISIEGFIYPMTMEKLTEYYRELHPDVYSVYEKMSKTIEVQSLTIARLKAKINKEKREKPDTKKVLENMKNYYV